LTSTPTDSTDELGQYLMGIHTLETKVSKLNFLVHGQVTIIFVVSVGLSVCLFVCAEFFSAIFDPISIKLGHVICLGLVVSPRI